MPTPTQWIDSISGLLGAIAWPIAAVSTFLVFRKPITTALPNLTRLKLGAAEAEFERAKAEVGSAVVESLIEDKASADRSSGQRPSIPLTEYYDKSAEANPLNAILEGFSAIERWFDQTLASHGLDNHRGTRKLGVRQMAQVAAKSGLVPSSTINQVEGLAVMRNLAIHEPGRATPEHAREFLVLADGVLYVLNTELLKHHARAGQTPDSKEFDAR